MLQKLPPLPAVCEIWAADSGTRWRHGYLSRDDVPFAASTPDGSICDSGRVTARFEAFVVRLGALMAEEP
jgi:hypothetical protein